MRKRVSKISDEKELASLWSANVTNKKKLMEFLNASVRTKMPSSNKVMPHDQMHWLKTLIFTHLRFIKAVAITPINIKMIKGVHLLTPRPNMLLKQQEENTAEKKKKEKLISLIDQFTISMDGWTAGQTQARHDPGFLSGRGVQAQQSEYKIRTWDQYIRTYTHTHTHTCACVSRHTCACHYLKISHENE